MAEQEHITSTVNGWWVTGLIDGEGCFYANLMFRNKGTAKGNEVACVELDIRLSVTLRDDDKSTLDKLHAYFGAGVVSNKKYNGESPSAKKYSIDGKPQRVFQIRRPQQLLDLVVPHFEKHPLQSKKANDYEVWKAILEFASSDLVGKKGWLRRFPEKVTKLQGLCDALKEVRVYPSLGVN